MRTLLSSLSVLALVACSAPDATTSTSAAAATRASSAMDAPADAPAPAATLAKGGTFWFVFDESTQVAAFIRERCAAKNPSETAVATCVDEVRKEGNVEGFRVHGADAAHLTWTSFGREGGKEVVFLEMPFAIKDTEGTRVHVRVTGPATGPQLHGAAGPSELTFEVVDGATIAMNDLEKGRLVFRAR